MRTTTLAQFKNNYKWVGGMKHHQATGFIKVKKHMENGEIKGVRFSPRSVLDQFDPII